MSWPLNPSDCFVRSLTLQLGLACADASERQLENAEMLCLIRLGKGLEVMNSLDKPEEAMPRQPMPQQQQPRYTPPPVAMAPAPMPVYNYEDDDGPVADDV